MFWYKIFTFNPLFTVAYRVMGMIDVLLDHLPTRSGETFDLACSALIIERISFKKHCFLVSMVTLICHMCAILLENTIRSAREYYMHYL